MHRVNIDIHIFSGARLYLRAAQRPKSQIEPESKAENKLSSKKSTPAGGHYLSDDTRGTDDDAHSDGFLATHFVCNVATHEAPKELPNRAYNVESSLPVGRKNWFTLEDVAKVAAESRNRNHSAVDLSVKPLCVGQKDVHASRKGTEVSLTIQQHTWQNKSTTRSASYGFERHP